MKSLLILAVLFAPAAFAKQYSASQIRTCIKAAELQLFKEVTKYEEYDDGAQSSRFEDFEFESEARVVQGRLFVTTATSIYVPGPYDGTRFVRWDYEMRPLSKRRCKVIAGQELEDEVYD
jgi:hypothetical protein